MKERHTVLFDLDGTLTPPRKGITKRNAEALKDLTRVAEVGIVTGSGIGYLKEQVPLDLHLDIEVLPCNGTQRWRLSGVGWELLDEGPNMRDTIGKSRYNELLLELDQYQRYTMMSHDLPYTGTFVSYRRSLVNWSPIGRDASDAERLAFEEFDRHHNWREEMLERISSRFQSAYRGTLQVKLGGSTSFDVFPTGWNKTYALRHFEDRAVWFVGDRTGPGGNDQEIFETLAAEGRAFSVKSERETPDVIDRILASIA
jgi:phosphomannomutase